MQAIPPEFRTAYDEHEQELTLRKTKWGCVLGAGLVPLFSGLDRYMYPEQAREFLVARLSCAALMVALYPSLVPRFSRKYIRLRGVAILFLPTATIAWMIFRTTGAASPYYAGLILVLMFLAVLLDWSFWQSVASVSLVWLLYLLACLFSPAKADLGIIANNWFFMVSTGITIIIGTWYHSDLRQRDFVTGRRLEKSQRELAAQNDALNQANREIKAAEMQLVQSEKMSSLGRFSAGLMHDILNPLNYIRTGLFDLHKKNRRLPPDLQKDSDATLADIEDGLKRVDNLISDLRTFTHPGEQPAETVELADVFDTSLRFISNELKEKNILLELALVPGQTAWFSRNQFILVLVNVLENAIDALGEKHFSNGEQPAIHITGRYENDRSLIFIRDNGTGIKLENQAKIFDPFFTTKDIGKGTGLGLSICFGIIRGYGGSISAASEPGKYSEFTLDLPTAPNKPENAN